MGQLATTAQATKLAQANPQKGLQEVIKSQWGKIEAVMPKHMSSERLFQLTISSINHEPKLMQADVATLLSCVMKCSALGLEPSAVDGLGRAYILPFRNKGKMAAQFILGYKGMIELARRSGQIKSIEARAVYAGDTFEYEFGLEEKLRHIPSGKKHADGEKLTHVYMVAHFVDGGHHIEVMTYEEVEAIRKRSKAANNGPWVSDYEAMAKKTVIRRAFPYLPVSVEAKAAVENEGDTAAFLPELNIEPLEVETTPETAPESPSDDGDTEPRGLRKAVCLSCGNVADVAPDAQLEDLASIPCCETPNYQFMDEAEAN